MINDPADLDPASPDPIVLAPALLERLAAIRVSLLDSLASGEPVYGVTTGMGALSKVRLTEEETAAALGISQRTVAREWVTAKGWLYQELRRD